MTMGPPQGNAVGATGESREPWTVRSMLRWIQNDFTARHMSTPRLDAELLLCVALQLDRVQLYMDFLRPLNQRELSDLRALVARRRANEPVSHLRGGKEFYGRWFTVNRSTLTPRPETETLVEIGLGDVHTWSAPRVLDMCTGSGAVGITVALEAPHAEVVVADVSAEALQVAKKNVHDHDLSTRISILEGDLFAPVSDAYEVILCNPPYVSEKEWEDLMPEVRLHEPPIALVSGEDGLDLMRRIATGAANHLQPGGVIHVEMGHQHQRAAVQLFEDTGDYGPIRVTKDLSGIPRFITAYRGTAPIGSRARSGQPSVDGSLTTGSG